MVLIYRIYVNDKLHNEEIITDKDMTTLKYLKVIKDNFKSNLETKGIEFHNFRTIFTPKKKSLLVSFTNKSNVHILHKYEVCKRV